MAKKKFTWQFNGYDSLKIAEHQMNHLKEFFEREKIDILDIGTKNINEFVSISFVIADEKFEETIKNALKPHFISKDIS